MAKIKRENNMNIEKLEKLSCLKINQEQKKEILSSIEGVVLMLKEIDLLKVKESIIDEENITVFRQASQIKNDSKSGLHLEDGYFLAPKVITRD